MPNWCYTDVTFTGEKENIDKLERGLNIFESQMQQRKKNFDKRCRKLRPRVNAFREKLGLHVDHDDTSLPIVKWNEDNRVRSYFYQLTNGEDDIINNWSGFLLQSLSAVPSKGFMNHICKENSIIRGGMEDWQRIDDESLYITFMDAWYPKVAVLDLIANRFNLEYVFLAEEPGCEVYINTDEEENFYETKFRVSSNYEEHGMEDAGFGSTLSQALGDFSNDYVSKLLNLSKSEKARYYKDLLIRNLEDGSTREVWKSNCESIDNFSKELETLSDDFDINVIVDSEEFLKQALEEMDFYIDVYDDEYCRCCNPTVVKFIESGEYTLPTTYPDFESAKKARRKSRRKARLRRKRRMRK